MTNYDNFEKSNLVLKLILYSIYAFFSWFGFVLFIGFFTKFVDGDVTIIEPIIFVTLILFVLISFVLAFHSWESDLRKEIVKEFGKTRRK